VGKSSLMNAIIGKKVTNKFVQGNWCDTIIIVKTGRRAFTSV
jgi:ribosome biogenesis GTPase A